MRFKDGDAPGAVGLLGHEPEKVGGVLGWSSERLAVVFCCRLDDDGPAGRPAFTEGLRTSIQAEIGLCDASAEYRGRDGMRALGFSPAELVEDVVADIDGRRWAAPDSNVSERVIGISELGSAERGGKENGDWVVSSTLCRSCSASACCASLILRLNRLGE